VCFRVGAPRGGEDFLGAPRGGVAFSFTMRGEPPDEKGSPEVELAFLRGESFAQG